MDAAYTLARQHYKVAGQAVFMGLDSQFSGTDFDTVYHVAERAMQLHIASLELARKVWAGSFPYDKAREVLQNQFNDFPKAVCERAFSDAYLETR